MASLFPDFKYDVFISYNQKNNKYESWVTEFVDNLNEIYYRDQINKVANTVKEIITEIKKHTQHYGEVLKKAIRVKANSQNNQKAKIIVGSLLIMVLISLVYFFIPKSSGRSDSVEKTIAVLPFQNLSNDTVQLPFCDGFMENILTNLQKVKSFTVRPKTSSYQYRETNKSPAIIGKELNVSYLVGGSVGSDGNNLKIHVYLIDSKADKQMWSNDYSREIKQLFSIHSDIVKEIASELKTVLSPEEIKKIEKKPTENLEAYNYYLQGNYYYGKASLSGENGNAIELYEKAIGLDPGFALAFTGIANCLLDQYWFYKNHSDNMLRKSRQAIDKALEIDPDLPDAHLALGLYYYHGYLKYPEALKQFEMVLKNQPKNPDVIYCSACVHRRAGNWEIAKAEFEKAIELNPGRSDFAEDAGETFDLLRDYSKAEKFYNMSIILKPDYVLPYSFLSGMHLRWNGDMRKAREILGNAALNIKTSISDSLIIETNVLIDIYEGNYGEALKDITLLKSDVIQNSFYLRPKYLYKAIIYGLMNEPELEHTCYDSARFFLERRMINIPDDPRLFSSLGIVYAGLGLYDKAISAGEKATKLLPVSIEAYRGIFLVEDLAMIYVMVGKYDDAIRKINYLLSIPGLLSTKILELDPRWAPLKDQPEFKRILETYSKK